MEIGPFVRRLFGTYSPITKLLEKIAFIVGISARRRRKFAEKYYEDKISLLISWSKKRTENYNFYYELTDKNVNDLCHLLATIWDCKVESVRNYASELIQDKLIRRHIQDEFLNDPNMRDAEIAFARRLGWYIIIRLQKPKIVVETGVHQGVGAVVISSALLRNRAEGFQGEYLGVDIETIAGVLFKPPYDSTGQIVISDSIEFMKTFQKKVDLFISDSDHTENYEMAEYESFIPLLNSNSVILSDNSHANSVLADFSEKYNRPYIFFKEDPLNHWYPGAGIGISLPSTKK